jgi:hypothetical protein
MDRKETDIPIGFLAPSDYLPARNYFIFRHSEKENSVLTKNSQSHSGQQYSKQATTLQHTLTLPL